MTIAELLARTETERKAAERRQSEADEAIARILRKAVAEKREDLTEDEDRRLKQLNADKRQAREDIAKADGQLAAYRKVAEEEDELARSYRDVRPTGAGRRAVPEPDGARFVRLADGRPAAVARGQRFADHPVVGEYAASRTQAEQAVVGQHGSFGNQLRAMTTTSGSAVVPTIWAGDIIDRARNLSAVLRAGAEIIPMDAKVVQVGRLTTDPVAAFRAEGSTVSASDPVFDNVTLTATTMSALVIGSMEWFQDALNVDDVVSEAIAAAVATELDLNALMGGLTTGGEVGATGYNRTFPIPPNPRGVLATLLAVAASSVLGSGANGTAQTATSFWREVQQTLFTVLSFNEAPTGLLWNSKLAQIYTDAYDTTNQPLRMPENIAELPKFITNQIESFTQGTMTNVATDLFVGDWRQLLIGQRLNFTVQTLVERYAELGQVGIVAHWRGDIAPARPRAFAVYRYLQGAA